VPDQKINGKQHYLWRAVDQDGEVVDVFLQARRDGAAAKRFFKRLSDKLRRYGVAHRELMPDVMRDLPKSAFVPFFASNLKHCLNPVAGGRIIAG
jgi:transposase-like protein